ncbi:choice-of-anchor B domain-containing protein [Lishizhenia tianjinensis]|uniref:Choice-of-anchor B domain-containing protein n=1 Tax=Lishizhenia tianjinensis TaxID=477690 RepID=A0A1I6Y4N4_9FLAO|nr:choice-of-anchor B family protein [Lishizhenia tianjinensis]SFT45302.1 choice-of-anchor B domain-containing protein [Lishizhenia tianjinensis]
MKRNLLLGFIFTGICVFNSALAQLNIDSLSHIDYVSTHTTFLNDVWGYTDELNNEYALVGAENGVAVVDVTQPSNPQEIFWETGAYSVWRDLKTFGDYAYVTTEADAGLFIMDLSGLPSNTQIPTTYFTGGNGVDTLGSAHNLWIDENGFCYIFGANIGNGGVQIYDLNPNPLQPTWVGEFDSYYCHDGYVRNDTAYFAHIYEGFFTVVDVSDKANPVVLGSKDTPTNFAHNIWLSDDGNTAFTTDEITNSYITAYDVSDPTSIVELDRIQSNPGTNTVPHNSHVLGDYVITSYYADGVVIHDVSDPENMVEVGNYDTYPGTSTSTVGNWGVYPFFASGNIMATDRAYGLFILGPTYVQASKLEGVTTNAATNALLDDVRVTIANNNQEEFSKLDGSYKTGIAQAGARVVNYYKYGFQEETRTVNFVNGQTQVENVALTPLPAFNLTVNVEDNQGNPIFGAFVELSFPAITLNTTSNGLGEAQFNLYYEDNYDLTIGKWGYVTSCEEISIDQNTGQITVVLEEGYYDDFTFDFGWSSYGDAEAGLFERVVPLGQGDIYAPSQLYGDSPWDCGEMAYVTGNGVNYDEVTNGVALLTSPVFDVTNIADPYVNYRRFFFNEFGPFPPDDTLRISLSNGIETVIIDKEGATGTDFVNKSIRIADFLTPTANMQLTLSVSDIEPQGNIVEVVFDEFYISAQDNSSTQEVSMAQALHIYPNPTEGIVNLNTTQKGELIVYDQTGRIVFTQKVYEVVNQLDLSALNAGVYTLVLEGAQAKIVLQ